MMSILKSANSCAVLVNFMFTEFLHGYHVLRLESSCNLVLRSISVLLNFIVFILLLSTVHIHVLFGLFKLPEK